MPASQTLRYLVGPLELIHSEAGPGLLRLTRLGVFGLWLLKLVLDPLWRLANFPRELLSPVGIVGLIPSALLGSVLSETGLTVLWILIVAVLMACLTNRFFVVTSTLAGILLTFYSSLIRCYGPTVHTDIILLLAVYALALFAWADWIEERREKRHPSTRLKSWSSIPLITIVAMLCLSYCFVALNRTMAGGTRVFTGNTMEVWAVDAGLRGYYFNTGLGWRIPQWPTVVAMLRTGLPIITLFEMSAPLCLVSSHFRWVFIPVMLSFHLLSLVLMNIFFFDNICLFLLLVDWSRKYPILATAKVSSSRHDVPLEASSGAPAP